MRILVVQTSFLGDVILSTPVLNELLALFKKCELYTLTTPEGARLLEHDKRISGRLSFDKHGKEGGAAGLLRKAREIRSYGFDRAYILQRSYRTSLLLWLSRIPLRIAFRESRLSLLHHVRVSRGRGGHDVERNLRILAHDTDPASISGDMTLIAPAIELVRPEIGGLAQGPYAIVSPGSAWATKRWSREGFRQVSQWLLARGLRVVLIGSESDSAICGDIAAGLALTNLAGRTSLPELLFLVSRAKLLLCNDSMALHVASAFKVPTVAVFCATSPAFGFGPWKNRAVVIEKEDLACRPCSRHGSQYCPTGTESCMRDVEASRVIEGVKQVLGAESENAVA